MCPAHEKGVALPCRGAVAVGVREGGVTGVELQTCWRLPGCPVGLLLGRLMSGKPEVNQMEIFLRKLRAT